MTRALEEMPKDLHGIYEAMLGQISSHNQDMAREALLWVCYAYEPLTLAALCEALVLEEGDVSLDDHCRLHHPETVLNMCQGLIVYDENTSTVTLAHSSVRTFLTSHHICCSPVAFYHLDDVEAARTIFRKCLRYLMFDEFKRPCLEHELLRKRFINFPLLGYAARNWASHCGHGAPAGFTLSVAEVDDVLTFFGTRDLGEKGGNATAWMQVLLVEAPVQIARSTEPLYYASSYGLLSVVERLLKDGAAIDAYGGRACSTALQVACCRDRFSVARVLLDAGANPNSTNCYGISNLKYARLKRLKRIEKLLLEKGATEAEESASRNWEEEASTAWTCCCCSGQNFSALSPACPLCGHYRCPYCENTNRGGRGASAHADQRCQPSGDVLN